MTHFHCDHVLRRLILCARRSFLHATPNSTGSRAGIRQAVDGAQNPRHTLLDDRSVDGTFSAPNVVPVKVSSSSTFADKARVRVVAGEIKAASALVLYLYAPGDKFSRGNLDFFIKNGIREGDGLDYIILVPKVWPAVSEVLLSSDHTCFAQARLQLLKV